MCKADVSFFHPSVGLGRFFTNSRNLTNKIFQSLFKSKAASRNDWIEKRNGAPVIRDFSLRTLQWPCKTLLRIAQQPRMFLTFLPSLLHLCQIHIMVWWLSQLLTTPFPLSVASWILLCRLTHDWSHEKSCGKRNTYRTWNIGSEVEYQEKRLKRELNK